MDTIGILAYGSLIEDPGEEISSLLIKRIETKTPFPVEYARKSRSRDFAPTLIPHDNGISVNAQILVLKSDTLIQVASDILYKRETRKSSGVYSRPTPVTNNSVLVEQLLNFEDVGTVLFTKIGSNIVDLTSETLAALAIESAKANAGANKKDGINYLISAKRNKIETKLTAEYESKILLLTNSANLEEAYEKCRNQK
jgi:hypothetical protein